MKSVSLETIVTFQPGLNKSRQDKDLAYYDQEAFDRDLASWALYADGFRLEEGGSASPAQVKAGDMVLNPITLKASLIGVDHQGLYLSNNFIKLVLDSQVLDPAYFIYYINESFDFKKQVDQLKQGYGPLVRLPIKSLNEMNIQLPDLSRQVQLGKIYRESQKLTYFLTNYAQQQAQASLAIIQAALKEETASKK